MANGGDHIVYTRRSLKTAEEGRCLQPSTQPATGLDVNGDSPAAAHARAAAAYIPFLTPEMLMPPKMPTTEEMEKVLLDLRKKALVEEYFGNEGS
jgi:pre-mRNA-splicing factor ISY1